MHASELATLQRRASSTPEPGSIAEADALEEIEQARWDEQHVPTSAQKRRRAERYWRDRGHQLGH